MSKGIDYGMGTTNIDHETGIRFGVIPVDNVLQAWAESSLADYGNPTCPLCGNSAIQYDEGEHAVYRSYLDGSSYADYACEDDEIKFLSDYAFAEQPHALYVAEDDLVASQDTNDTEIVIEKSPYYTRAAFCSPAAPGACYLLSPTDGGQKAYCFGTGWFDDEYPCPYPVYRVDTDECIYTPNKEDTSNG